MNIKSSVSLTRARILLSLALVIQLSGFITPAAAQDGGPAQPPNVVLILIDDLGPHGLTHFGWDRVSDHFGTFENLPIATPRLDALAASGVYCEQAYVYPLCEPSRVALMTGQYNSRNFLAPKSLHASQITFGDLFQRAGYATGMFGKWKQTRGTPEIAGTDYIYEFGWDEFACFDVTTEGQRFINPHLVINGETQNYTGRADLDPHTGRRWYGPDICNRLALEFIDEHQDEPFFLYYPMILVHDEHKPTPDTLPHTLFDECDEDKAYDDKRYFPDMLAYMDKLIGQVIDRLDAHGLRENTVIMIIGDNGTKEPFIHIDPDGNEYRGGKGGTRENGLLVPLIVEAPGMVPGERVYDGLIDVTDILPTLCAAASVAIPNRNAIDGISFWPQLTGAATEPARDVIYTWYNGNNRIDDPTHLLRYAFDGEFKRYAPHRRYTEGRFFDLRTDPLEEGGDRREHVIYDHYHHSGLSTESLTDEQRAAYDRLGAVLDAHRDVAVTELRLAWADDADDAGEGPMSVGDQITLAAEVLPAHATRNGVIFESSDPSIVTVDKFGVVTAVRPGDVQITVYSWDDAWPLANQGVSLHRDGIQHSVLIRVAD